MKVEERTRTEKIRAMKGIINDTGRWPLCAEKHHFMLLPGIQLCLIAKTSAYVCASARYEPSRDALNTSM
jgi:hypothetical protein